MLLDTLATRYHLLPSEVLDRADTLDILVSDVAMSWHRHIQEQEAARAKNGAPAAPHLSVNTMQEMMRKVRG